jgi:hypothetical protein
MYIWTTRRRGLPERITRGHSGAVNEVVQPDKTEILSCLIVSIISRDNGIIWWPRGYRDARSTEDAIMKARLSPKESDALIEREWIRFLGSRDGSIKVRKEFQGASVWYRRTQR